MRVEATKQAVSGQPNNFAGNSGSNFAGNLGREVERERTEAAATESRALVVTQTAAAVQTTPVYREAAFLAHLIATKDHAPQTRERRRAEPSEAISAYRSVIALTN